MQNYDPLRHCLKKGNNVQIQNTILINANLMLIFESAEINAMMTEKKQSMDASRDEKE